MSCSARCRWWRKRVPFGRDGFTLLEALVVVTVIGILTALSVIRSETPRSRAATAAMQSDLHSVGAAEEAYYADHGSYASDIGALDIQLSPGVTMQLQANAQGWTARATHQHAPNRECALAFGGIAPLSPATGSGVLVCEQSSGGGLGCGG